MYGWFLLPQGVHILY